MVLWLRVPSSVALLFAVLFCCATACGEARTPATSPSARPMLSASRAVGRRMLGPARARSAISLLGDGFSGSSTAPNAWLPIGGACLTAGNSSTPSTSIPACGSLAPQDAAGQGALQLTPGSLNQSGMVVATTPVATKNGLQITFTDYAFAGTTPGADGMTVFLTHASQPRPTAIGGLCGSLGYANQTGQSGIANAYLGVALDEY
ncbi:MAG: hypothetical protein IAI50_10845, partial [Candidatus Eremiobacteraeota bacterium]|nr:hypothetical protein [Candidatus Eremiobacteraeota bacterium]